MTDDRSAPDREGEARRGSSRQPYLHWFRDWGPEAVFLLVTTIAGLWAGGRWINPISDPGFSWSLSHRLSQGERLYRDIYFAYAPLSPYLLAGAARVFGTSVRFALLSGWIPAILAGLLLLRLGRSLLSTIERLALVTVLLASSIFAPGDGRLVFPYYAGVVHALVFSMAALLLFRKDGGRFESRSFPAGLLAGLAFCCKQEIGLAALLALSAPVAMRPRRAFSWIGRLLGGFCLAVLPVAIFAFRSAPLQSLREDSHLWPLALSPPAAVAHLLRTVTGLNYPNWPATLRESIFHLLLQIGLAGLLALLVSRERDRSAWLRVLSVLVGLSLWWVFEAFSARVGLPSVSLWMSAAFLVAILALFNPSFSDRALTIACGVFAGVAGVRTAFSPFLAGQYDGPGHFASGLTWVLFLCVFAPRLLLRETRSASTLRVVMALLLLISFGRQAAAGIESLRYPGRVAVETAQGRVFAEKAPASVLDAIRRNSVPGERVFVIPENNDVDVMFRLKNVSPLVNLMPGWLGQDVERRLIERFEKDPPDLVVVFERPVLEFGLQPFGKGYGLLLADWCNRNYAVVESTPGGTLLRPPPRSETSPKNPR